MKWYLIKEEYEAKIIGNVRGLQSEEMIAGYNYGGDNSVGKIPSNSYNNSKFSNTDFGKILLKPAAHFTDRISSVHINQFFIFVISERLADFFKKFKLPDIFEKEVGVVHPKMGIEKNYRAFYMENNYLFIDYN